MLACRPVSWPSFDSDSSFHFLLLLLTLLLLTRTYYLFKHIQNKKQRRYELNKHEIDHPLIYIYIYLFRENMYYYFIYFILFHHQTFIIISLDRILELKYFSPFPRNFDRNFESNAKSRIRLAHTYTNTHTHTHTHEKGTHPIYLVARGCGKNVPLRRRLFHLAFHDNHPPW